MKKPQPTIDSSIDFDLRQLEIFRNVVDLSSFSKAAEAVCLAQASVSERIATLENMVGTRLLDRMGRKVVPTKAGELLYKHAVLLLDMKRAACLEMQDFLGLKGGEVRVGGSTIPGEYILPKILKDFRDHYPFVSVTLAIANSREIERRVLDGNLELGVVGSKSAHRNLVSHTLWEDELVLAVPSGHRWASKKEIKIRELPKEVFILRETGSGTLKIMEDKLGTGALKSSNSLNVVARLGTSSAVKEGVKAGLGISILSFRALETELKAGILKALKIKDFPMTRRFYLIRDSRKIDSPLCRALRDFLVENADLKRLC